MSELHWTGAALLLAVAVLGGRSTAAPRDVVVSWSEFARQHGIADDPPGATGSSPRATARARQERRVAPGRGQRERRVA